jgi:hypothetical protein
MFDSFREYLSSELRPEGVLGSTGISFRLASPRSMCCRVSGEGDVVWKVEKDGESQGWVPACVKYNKAQESHGRSRCE